MNQETMIPAARQLPAAPGDADIETAASVAYNAMTEFALRSGLLKPGEAVWFADLDLGARAEVLESARYTLDNLIEGAELRHRKHLAALVKAGWTYGETFDAEARRTPVMRPWHMLDARHRQRMRLFVATVQALV